MTLRRPVSVLLYKHICSYTQGFSHTCATVNCHLLGRRIIWVHVTDSLTWILLAPERTEASSLLSLYELSSSTQTDSGQ